AGRAALPARTLARGRTARNSLRGRSRGDDARARAAGTSGMSAPLLDPLLRAARQRDRAIVVSGLLPWAIVAAALAWRVSGLPATVTALLAAGLVIGLIAWQRARRLDRGWLQRRLDARHP